MFGPVSSANNTPSNIPFAISEALGTFLVFIAAFGKPRFGGSPNSKFSRLLGAVLFLMGGSALLWFSAQALCAQGSATTAIVIFAATAAVVFVLQFVRWRKYRGWQAWPLADATVETVEVREVRTRNSHYWAVEVAYSYVVNGDYQAGSYSKDFLHESEADEYADSIRGHKLAVNFNPDHSELSRCADADS